ncbi:MAG: ribonuclease R [Ignavibacteria bacterium]
MKLKQDILKLLSKNENDSFKVNSILKKLHLKQDKREALKKALSELVKEEKLSKDKKYYNINLKIKTGKETKRNKDKPSDKGSRSDNTKRHDSQNRLNTSYRTAMPGGKSETGEIDFGKDGRMVLKKTGKNGNDDTIIIKDVKTHKLKIGDKVEYRPVRSSDGKETTAEITKVLTEGNRFVSGRFEDHKDYGLVYPDSRDIKKEIIIARGDFKNAADNDKVHVEIINIEDVRDEFSDLRGRVIEVFGKSGEKGAEEKSIIRKYNLSTSFPKEVEQEANAIRIDYDMKDRMDLRDKIIFTIDPLDAKDFDDAVSIEKNDDGYLIGVHIADVSHYVRENSDLDKEALRRATSVYLVKNVIPMLPEKLSNDICSLKPNEDRLTFSIFIQLTKKCTIKSFDIRKTVINSKRRFTYEEAQNIIETKTGDFAEELLLMYKLSKSITVKRLKEESLDFDSAEVKFVFNKDGAVEDIIVKERLDSMRLIEEFMLLANKCATLYVNDLSKKNKMYYPFVYRVHDIPNKDKMKELSEFVKQFGYSINIEDKNSLRKLLNEIHGKPEEFIINDLLIRSMAKAIYTTKNIGHYGLGFKDYTHFTSPIRRYPDLVVHRILHDYLNAGKNIHDVTEHYKKILPEICKQSSIMEQNAEQAERESIKLMQGEYMKKHVGDTYEGIISGIVQYGMFVEIMDILVEGMIRFRDIEDDYYDYDEKKHIAFGRRKHKTFRAGQKVRIKVVRVNSETKRIDFVLVS